MKRKLIVASLVLLALAGMLAMRLHQDWLDAQAREREVLMRQVKPLPLPPPAPPSVPPPVKAAGYIDIAQKMLFSKDRNPTVIVEAPPPPKPKPMPPFPIFHGLYDFGEGPEAILSEKAGAPHRDYRIGDKIGEFTLLSVNREEIEFEWDGKSITKRVDEIIDRGAPPAPAPAAAAASTPATAAAAAPAKPAEPAKTAPAAPGQALDDRGTHICQAGDSSPAGTVTDGMRKIVKVTPFGKACYWEPVH